LLDIDFIPTVFKNKEIWTGPVNFISS